jgi:hypothetical protein
MWDFLRTQRNIYFHFIDNVCNEFVSAKSGTLITKKKICKSVTRAGFTFLVFYLCARPKLYITVTKFEIRTLLK